MLHKNDNNFGLNLSSIYQIINCGKNSFFYERNIPLFKMLSSASACGRPGIHMQTRRSKIIRQKNEVQNFHIYISSSALLRLTYLVMINNTTTTTIRHIIKFAVQKESNTYCTVLYPVKHDDEFPQNTIYRLKKKKRGRRVLQANVRNHTWH